MQARVRQQESYTAADYYELPEETRVELIRGVFYDQAAPSRIHQRILSELHIMIGSYIRSRGGSCHVYPAPFAVELHTDGADTVVEPDISVVCDRSKLTERGCSGAPDWIIEIVSPGNPSRDYIEKLKLYAGAGVREYWIVDPRSEEVFVYWLAEERFRLEAYSFQDKIRAGIYEDLEINFADIAEQIKF